MSKPNNIWEVESLKQIVNILRENQDKFIILAITLDKSTNSDKKMLKTFLKSKHIDFPNMFFLYYCASKIDLGRFSLIIDDKFKYPLIYSIYNENIYIKVSNIDEIGLNDFFAEGLEYYIKDRELFLNGDIIDDKIDIANENIIEQNNKINIENNLNNQDNQINQNNQDKIKEHEQLQNRINIFKQYAKDFNIEFLQDVKERKEKYNNKNNNKS